MKIHHIGYAVKYIEKALEEFILIGFKKLSEIEDVQRSIYIIFIEKDGYVIELISPLSSDSPINKLISKNGPIPYHMCYETDEFYKDLDRLKKTGWITVEKPKNAIAINNALVAFLYSKYIGIVEIVEKKVN